MIPADPAPPLPTAVLRLPDPWIAHLECGVSMRIAARAADGMPHVRRAMAARVLADGRVEVLVPYELGAALLRAVTDSRHVAVCASNPITNLTVQLKGRDAEVGQAHPTDEGWYREQCGAFADRVAAFGFPRERMLRLWFDGDWSTLALIRFTPYGAWDQTPGIGAGSSIEMVEDPLPPVQAARRVGALVPAPEALADVSVAPTPTLREVRSVLDGIIPPSMSTVSAEGVPHVTFLSHAEYVDESHIALTYQFFNRSRANVLATERAALMVECPYSGARVIMQLRYRRTETTGPVFERLRAKLAGIAAHTGMEKVFRLLGADVFEVESLERNDTLPDAPGKPTTLRVADGARQLAARLAEVQDLPQLMPTFLDGLRELLQIDHAIVWLLDEGRQLLTTLASQGYANSGVGSELALDDAGLAGVALREGVPIRIGHMSQMYRYGLSWRARAEGVGLQAVIARAIPLPGLERPGGQLAVPLRARGRSVGVLLVETVIDARLFGYDDEDALTLLGAQLAQAMTALQVAELSASAAGAARAAPTAAALASAAVPARPLAAAQDGAPETMALRHWPRDHTVFVDDEYLIKGVAGAILWRLATEQVQRGRDEFTTRELRLAGGDLGLPDVQDNLGVRLLLLERRLAERQCGLSIERTGRGRFRLVTTRPLRLQEEAAG